MTPPTPSARDVAATTVLGAPASVALIGVAGITVSVIRLRRGVPAWPVALLAVVVAVTVLVVGALGYLGAVG